MGLLEEQARFLTAKYGTAAGPTGLPREVPYVFDAASSMIILGLLLFAVIVYVLYRDWQAAQAREKTRLF